jgi:hypothetical protein
MTKTLNDFYNDLGARESGGNYSSVNKYGYVGKYQMGEAAMIDAGYYKKPSGKYNNDWSGQFTGKDGIYSVQDFLKNKQAQENAQKAFKQAQWNQLKAIGADKYIGKEINGVKITQSGLLAAAHLKGPGAVKEYLQSDGKNIPKDAFGTSVESYMKKFEGYDVSNVTGIKDSKTNDNTSKSESIEKEPLNYNQNVPFELSIQYNDYQQNNLPDLNDLMINPINQQPDNPWDMIPMAIPESLRQPSNVPTGQAANQSQQSGLFGYTNPLTGSNHIYTREEVGQMNSSEFAKHEKEIDAQLKSFNGTMPTNGDLYRESISNGGVVYVHPYTRSDGTEVRGYYRSR